MSNLRSHADVNPGQVPQRGLLRDLEQVAGLEVLQGVPLAPVTSFRIGGPARVFLRPADVAALERTVAYLGRMSIEYRILGQGSNLLIDDGGVGVVLSLVRLGRFQVLVQGVGRAFSADPHHGWASGSRCHVLVEAGCRLRPLLAWAVRQGWQGLEGLAGIPASMGGAAAMNAGTGAAVLSDVVERLLLVTSEGSAWWSREDLSFGYRQSGIPPGAVVAAVEITLEAERPSEVRRRTCELMAHRRRAQPLGMASAGCVFRNPPGFSAGWLIEACGLKGHHIGDAEVSGRHANFIVNRGDARAADVLALMEEIRSRVWREAGVFLVPEICIWARPGYGNA
jgi:UDP-N-acetylmuramate dehydrogenase